MDLANKVYALNPSWNVHEGIKQIYKQKLSNILNEKKVDWSDAESLAFASLLEQGFNIRLSGQYANMGTFKERYLELIDQKTLESYLPIEIN